MYAFISSFTVCLSYSCMLAILPSSRVSVDGDGDVISSYISMLCFGCRTVAYVRSGIDDSKLLLELKLPLIDDKT